MLTCSATIGIHPTNRLFTVASPAWALLASFHLSEVNGFKKTGLSHRVFLQKRLFTDIILELRFTVQFALLIDS